MKKLKYLLIIMLLLVTVGCFKKDKTYEFKAQNTSETIKLTVSNEYKLSEKEPIKVTKGEEELASIIFITKTNYEEVIKLFENKTLVPITQGKNGNNDYYLYKVSEEYNYIMLIDDSNTAVAMTTKSEETSKKLAEEIKFSK